MLRYERGDVFDGPEKVIIHGCNCFKAMGAGIARQVREKFPQAYAADQQTLWGDKTKLGDFTYAEENGIILVNAYTQYRYTRTDVDVDYDAVRLSMIKICQKFSQTEFAMPKIGAGLAGGDWKVIERILIEVSDKYDKTFVVYEL